MGKKGSSAGREGQPEGRPNMLVVSKKPKQPGSGRSIPRHSSWHHQQIRTVPQPRSHS